MSQPIALRPLGITASLTDLIPKQMHPLAHAKMCARGIAALADRHPCPGELAEQPERLVASWVVSYGEGRDAATESGVKLHELPALVLVQLAVPADWSMDQVEAALRLLGQRVHAAAPGDLASAPKPVN